MSLPKFGELQLDSIDGLRSLRVVAEPDKWRFMRYNWMTHDGEECWMWDENYHFYANFDEGIEHHMVWLEGGDAT